MSFIFYFVLVRVSVQNILLEEVFSPPCLFLVCRASVFFGRIVSECREVMPKEPCGKWKKRCSVEDENNLTYVVRGERVRSLPPAPLYFQNCFFYKPQKRRTLFFYSDKFCCWCLRAGVSFHWGQVCILIFSTRNNPCLVVSNQTFRMLKFLFLSTQVFKWKNICLRRSTVVNTSSFAETIWNCNI